MRAQITNVVAKTKMVGIPGKKLLTPHCNSLNSSFLSVKPWLTFTDKGVLMLWAWPSLLFCWLPRIQIPWTEAVMPYDNTAFVKLTLSDFIWSRNSRNKILPSQVWVYDFIWWEASECDKCMTGDLWKRPGSVPLLKADRTFSHEGLDD